MGRYLLEKEGIILEYLYMPYPLFSNYYSLERTGKVREIGFSREDWPNYETGKPKMASPIFTTFRWPWKNGKEYHSGEIVKVVLHRRSKNRKILGTALITEVEALNFVAEKVTNKTTIVTTDIPVYMAQVDGFRDVPELINYLIGGRPPHATDYVLRYTLEWQDGLKK